MSQSGFSKVSNDLIQLCELQWQLLAVDLQEAKRVAIPAGAWLTAAAVLGLPAATILSIASGFALNQWAALSLPTAFAVTAAGLALMTGLTAWIGLRYIQQVPLKFNESRSEFNENVKWLRATLMSPDSPRNQMALGRSQAVHQAPTQHSPTQHRPANNGHYANGQHNNPAHNNGQPYGRPPVDRSSFN